MLLRMCDVSKVYERHGQARRGVSSSVARKLPRGITWRSSARAAAARRRCSRSWGGMLSPTSGEGLVRRAVGLSAQPG